MSEREIFTRALEMVDPSARKAFLDHACSGDAKLLHRINQLLAANAENDSLLDEPAPMLGMLDAASTANANQRPATTPSTVNLSFLTPTTMSGSLGRIGHYEVLEVLGQGGFGIVFRAYDDILRRVVAVKVLAPELASTSPPRQRFLREARAAARIRHENVVQVHSVEDQPLPFLVMEFIPGETLQDRVNQLGPLPIDQVLRIGRQLAEGLAAAHATGLIHRDIKPANIIIERGTNDHVKLTDFGLARAADDASMTQSGMVAGTPMFMSPEQARGEPLDHRSDLFSVGSVLYTIITGRPPFRAANSMAVMKRVVEDTPHPIRDIIPETPVWVCDMIAKLHAKSIHDRYPSAREVADLISKQQREMLRTLEVTPMNVAVETAPPRTLTRTRRPIYWLLILFSVFCGMGVTEATGVTNLRQTVIKLFSPEGTLIVEVDDPNVSVSIDGDEFVITGAGVKELRMKPGQYQLKAMRDGKVVRQQLVSISRDGREIVRVGHEPKAVKEVKEENDQTAIDWVKNRGGNLSLDDRSRLLRVDLMGRTGVWDDELAKLSGCTELVNVNLAETDITDTGLEKLRDCKNVNVLNLNHTTISDRSIPFLTSLPRLTDLHLVGTDITPDGLDRLMIAKPTCRIEWKFESPESKRTRLAMRRELVWLQEQLFITVDVEVASGGITRVELGRSVPQDVLNTTHLFITYAPLVDRMGDKVFDVLKSIKHCQFAGIHLEGNRITSAGIAQLIRLPCFSKLKRLHLDECSVGDDIFPMLAGVKSLESIDLTDCTKVTGRGISLLKACDDFNGVTLMGNIPITPQSMNELTELPSLRLLNLDGVYQYVTPEHLAPILRLKHLDHLHINRWPVTDTDAVKLGEMSNLAQLGVGFSPLTDEGLKHFHKLKKLEQLLIAGCKITPAGVADVQRALPRCVIMWKE